MKTIGQVLEQIFFDSGLSMREFSTQVGYSRQYIYDLFKEKDADGTTRKIQLDTLKQICDRTNYDLGQLLKETGYIKEKENQKLNKEQVYIINQLQQLDESNTNKVIGYINGLLENQNKEN